MPEYLVFPIPKGLMRVHASTPTSAKNKYIKASKEAITEALIVIPNNFGRVTIDDNTDVDDLNKAISIPKVE